MKKLKLISLSGLFLLITFSLTAQQTIFSRVIYSSSLVEGIKANSFVHTFDNAYLIVGEYDWYKGIIIKTDTGGNVLWNKIFSVTNSTSYPHFRFNKITSTIDSAFLVVGSSYSPVNMPQNAFYMKINTDGDTIWAKSISLTSDNAEFVAVEQTFDSGFIMTGTTGYNYQVDPATKVIVSKVNSEGILQWTNIMISGNKNNYGNSIIQLPDSNYMLVGSYRNDPPTENNAFLMNLSEQGSVLWAKKYQNLAPDALYGKGICYAKNGLYIYLNTYYRNCITRTNIAGDVIWSKSYYPNDHLGDPYTTKYIHQTSDSSLIFVAGDFFEGGMTKIDTSGNIIWADNLFLDPVDVWETNNNELFVIGNGPMQGIKNKDVYIPQIGIMQLDSMGIGDLCFSQGIYWPDTNQISSSPISFTSVIDGTENSVIPTIDTTSLDFYFGCVAFIGDNNKIDLRDKLLVYPNPSNGIFTFESINKEKAQIVIYNSVGEEIYNLETNETKSLVDLSRQPAGLYFYKYINSENSICGKLIIQ